MLKTPFSYWLSLCKIQLQRGKAQLKLIYHLLLSWCYFASSSPRFSPWFINLTLKYEV